MLSQKEPPTTILVNFSRPVAVSGSALACGLAVGMAEESGMAAALAVPVFATVGGSKILLIGNAVGETPKMVPFPCKVPVLAGPPKMPLEKKPFVVPG